jgi:hypothetical protein
MLEYFIVVIWLHISCNLDYIHAYVRKIYMVIVNRNLNMIKSCNEMVNVNCVTTSLTLTLSEQLLCNWRTGLMRTIMPHVQLNKIP